MNQEIKKNTVIISREFPEFSDCVIYDGSEFMVFAKENGEAEESLLLTADEAERTIQGFLVSTGRTAADLTDEAKEILRNAGIEIEKRSDADNLESDNA